MTDRPIHLILDTSAIIAYTHGSVAVGELLIEVDDDGGQVALPFQCLSEAASLVIEAELLAMLVDHQTTEVIADDPDAWRAHAAMRDIVGRSDAASAMLVTIDSGAHLLTGRPRLYASVGGDQVIAIDE